VEVRLSGEADKAQELTSSAVQSLTAKAAFFVSTKPSAAVPPPPPPTHDKEDALVRAGLSWLKDDALGRLAVLPLQEPPRLLSLGDEVGASAGGEKQVFSCNVPDLLRAVVSLSERLFASDAGLEPDEEVEWALCGLPSERGVSRVWASKGWSSNPNGVLVVVPGVGQQAGIWSDRACLFSGVGVGSALVYVAEALRRKMGVVLVPWSERGGEVVATRRVLRGVMQSLDRDATDEAEAWRKVVLVGVGDGCGVMLSALAPLGRWGMSPQELSMEMMKGGSSSAKGQLDEDKALVEDLLARRLGCIAMVEPTYKLENLSVLVWRLLVERGAAWMAATPGKAVADPRRAVESPIVGDLDIEALRSRFGCGVIGLDAPSLAAAASGEASADEDVMLLAAALTRGGDPPKIQLHRGLWRSMTPYRVRQAVFQFIETLQEVETGVDSGLRAQGVAGASRRNLRHSWALAAADKAAVPSSTSPLRRLSSGVWSSVTPPSGSKGSSLRRTSTLGGVVSPGELRKAAAGITTGIPESARVAASVAAFVQVAGGGDVSDTFGDASRRSSDDAESYSTIHLEELSARSRRRTMSAVADREVAAELVDDPPTTLPEPWARRAVEAVQRTVALAQPSAAVWGGVPAVRKNDVDLQHSQQGLPGVRGVGMVRASLRDVLTVLLDPKRAKDLDPSLDRSEDIPCSVAESFRGQFKCAQSLMKSDTVFLTPRDVVGISWWCMDAQGRVVFASASLPSSEETGLLSGSRKVRISDVSGECALPVSPSGYSRAWLFAGGWVVEPFRTLEEAVAAPPVTVESFSPKSIPLARSLDQVPRTIGYCRVTYVFQSHPGGSLSPGLVRGLVGNQGLIVQRLRELLPSLPAPPPSTAAALVETSPLSDGPRRREEVEKPLTDAARPLEVAEEDADDGDEEAVSNVERLFSPDTETSVKWIPGEEPLIDLTGTWRLDEVRSDPLREFLTAMGIPAAQRDAAAASKSSSTTIEHASACMSIEDDTDFGKSTQWIIPDGHPRAVGRAGATMMTAWYGRWPGIGGSIARQRLARLREAETAKAAAQRREAEAATKKAAQPSGFLWLFGRPSEPAATVVPTPPTDCPPPVAEDEEERDSDAEGGALADEEASEWEASGVSPMYRGYGSHACVLCVRTTLPEARGVVLEERWLLDRNTMRAVAALVRKGRVVATMVRYFTRALGLETEEDTTAEAAESTEAVPVSEELEPWVAVARRRELAQQLREAAAKDSSSPLSLLASKIIPPLDLSGKWLMDRDASDSIYGMMRAWGRSRHSARAAAAAAREAGLLVRIRQTSATLDIVERAEAGEGAKVHLSKRRLYLDGRDMHVHSSTEQESMRMRASIAPGDGSDAMRGYGPGAASITVTTYLPSHMGETVEVRRLLSWDRLELLTVVLRGGKEAARVRRVFDRSDSPAGMASAKAEAESLHFARLEQAGKSPATAEAEAREVASRKLSTLAGWAHGTGTEEAAQGPTAGYEDEQAPETVKVSEAPAAEAEPVLETSPFDLTGVWKVDNSRSEPLEPMLAAMGVPWMLRGLASRVDVTSFVDHSQTQEGPLGRGTTVVIRDSSSYGDVTQELVCDGQTRQTPGPDGKPVQRTVTLEIPWEVKDSWKDTVKGRKNFDGMGPDAPVLVTRSVLSDGAVTTDRRRLLDPHSLELVTSYFKEGTTKEPVSVRRVLARFAEQDDPAAAATRLEREAARRRARHAELLRRVLPPEPAAEEAPAPAVAESRPSVLHQSDALLWECEGVCTVRADGGVCTLVVRAAWRDEWELASADGEWRLGSDWRVAAALGKVDCPVVSCVAVGMDSESSMSKALAVTVAVPQGSVGPHGEKHTPLFVGAVPSAPEGGEEVERRPEEGAAVRLAPPACDSATLVGSRLLLTVRGAGPFLHCVKVSWNGEAAPVSRCVDSARLLVCDVDAGSSTMMLPAEPESVQLTW
jgi:hypothetical protein